MPGARLTPARPPRELLEMAEGLLRRPDPDTAGLWPRAAALLGCRALERALARVFEHGPLDPRGCPVRVQISCLRLALRDRGFAARVGLAWSSLRRASHHHAYELAPTAGELRGWLDVVEEVVRRAPVGEA